jgi:hypothetical protein
MKALAIGFCLFGCSDDGYVLSLSDAGGRATLQASVTSTSGVVVQVGLPRSAYGACPLLEPGTQAWISGIELTIRTLGATVTYHDDDAKDCDPPTFSLDRSEIRLSESTSLIGTDLRAGEPVWTALAHVRLAQRRTAP